jgi:hypothetical protein
VAALSSREEAERWVRSNRIFTDKGSPRITWKGKLKADLQLSAESLPFVMELLFSNNAEIALTASLALKHNGAVVESDATPDRDPTYFRVTFPDGTVQTRLVRDNI